MNPHVSDERLERFVAGDLPESQAVEAAIHIDGCVVCANRAAALEPLATVFAAAEDPELPQDFTASVLARLARPGLPLVELIVGSVLLLLAVGLLFVVDGPVRPVVDSLSVAHAVASVVERITSTLSVGEQAVIVLLTALGAFATIRLARRPGFLVSTDRRTAE